MPQIGRRGRQPIMGADAGRGGESMHVGVKGGKRWTKKADSIPQSTSLQG